MSCAFAPTAARVVLALFLVVWVALYASAWYTRGKGDGLARACRVLGVPPPAGSRPASGLGLGVFMAATFVLCVYLGVL